MMTVGDTIRHSRYGVGTLIANNNGPCWGVRFLDTPDRTPWFHQDWLTLEEN